jgi:hypothetical protein
MASLDNDDCMDVAAYMHAPPPPAPPLHQFSFLSKVEVFIDIFLWRCDKALIILMKKDVN